jgi:hypothetical protein
MVKVYYSKRKQSKISQGKRHVGVHHKSGSLKYLIKLVQKQAFKGTLIRELI